MAGTSQNVGKKQTKTNYLIQVANKNRPFFKLKIKLIYRSYHLCVVAQPIIINIDIDRYENK